MKKYVASFLTLLLLLGCALPAAAADAPEPEARQLPLTIEAKSKNTAMLSDGRNDTFYRAAPGEEITVSAGEAMDSIYILWDDEPLPCSVAVGGQSVPLGKSGFRHEYARLPGRAKSFTLHLPEEAAMRISGIYAFSAGRLPDWVQVWEPPCKKADLLLFPTHADDEFIFFGGLIPTYARERGAQVQVVYMTSHQRTARVRCHELLDGLWLAGVRNYPVINDAAPDIYFDTVSQAEAVYHAERFTAFQVEQIRRFRPLVIVGHAENGEYRNAVHMLNTRCLEDAVTLAADPEAYADSAEVYGMWDTPKTYLHLYGPEAERTVLDYETPLETFDGMTAYEVAVAAYAMHVSQATSLHFRIYSFGSPSDSHSFGLFRSLVGGDEEKNDLMENLTPAGQN